MPYLYFPIIGTRSLSPITIHLGIDVRYFLESFVIVTALVIPAVTPCFIHRHDAAARAMKNSFVFGSIKISIIVLIMVICSSVAGILVNFCRITKEEMRHSLEMTFPNAVYILDIGLCSIYDPNINNSVVIAAGFLYGYVIVSVGFCSGVTLRTLKLLNDLKGLMSRRTLGMQRNMLYSLIFQLAAPLVFLGGPMAVFAPVLALQLESWHAFTPPLFFVMSFHTIASTTTMIATTPNFRECFLKSWPLQLLKKQTQVEPFVTFSVSNEKKMEKLPLDAPPPYDELDYSKEEIEKALKNAEEHPEKITGVPIFEDKWSKILQDGHLVISCYFFPTARSKTIKASEISGVYYEKQKWELKCRVKAWGMALSPCWWACDICRSMHGKGDGKTYYNIAISVADDKLYKGFTCVEIDKFLKIIKMHVPPTTVVVEGLPF
ncbi:unnamed protein product [Caenorhabditis auriculariae]|uniref:G protein-coupled receptor n=1 Tax=Caenorhabditis auriculariae TaxID=2777116 RepID=A0A8S1HZF1_9PELO|nr:unnamed protein product [Caenorhabditis auriculariae]